MGYNKMNALRGDDVMSLFSSSGEFAHVITVDSTGLSRESRE